MDLSRLSTQDLEALQAGNLSAVSTEGLSYLQTGGMQNDNGPERGASASRPLSLGESAIGLLGQAGQGAGFNLVDEAAAIAATPVNMGISYLRGRPVGGPVENYSALVGEGRDLLKRTSQQYPVASVGANLAGGWKTGVDFLKNARSVGGLAGRFGALTGAYGAGDGENLTDRAINAGIQGTAGAAMGGTVGSLLNRALPTLTPSADELKSLYRVKKEGLKDIPISGQAVAEGLLRPAQEQVGNSIFAISGDAPRAALSDIQNFANKGTNAYQLDEFRSQLGGSPLETRLRGAIDSFTSGSGISNEYRRPYRLAKAAETLQSALNKGSESVTASRTRLRTAGEDIKGISPAIDQSVSRAGRQGIAETALRVGKIPGAILSAATGTGLNAASGLGVYAGGRLLDAAADGIARNRMRDALTTILRDGAPAPTFGERFGVLIGKK